MNGDSPTIWEETDEFNKSAKKSAAFGFLYDSANVKDGTGRLFQRGQRVQRLFDLRLVDPETAIPEL